MVMVAPNHIKKYEIINKVLKHLFWLVPSILAQYSHYSNVRS